MDFVGNYKLHVELDEKTFDKKGVKDSVSQAFSKAKEELSKVKDEMDLKMDTSKMDTSTAEGKMEFIAKSFAKTMASFGKDLGELGILMGEAAGDVAVKALDMTENLLQNIKMDVELQENGKIVTSSSIINNIQFVGSNWDVQNNLFLFKDENGKIQNEYTILENSTDRFVLAHDKYRLIFDRIKIQ
ncbi:MAG: hypothetical protein IPO78_03100 [Saprospiraceae bacterium]|nr:hypothetical protein [Saprospiraceae bacterium]MBK9223059.1 hypothetical protein [Saprospiraceae bacterium]MBK9720589.1 hypothetical protein [Saprospiraceae bacterium]